MGIVFNSFKKCEKIVNQFIDLDFVENYDFWSLQDKERFKNCSFEWGLGDDGFIFCRAPDPLAHALCMKADVWNDLNTLHYMAMNCDKMYRISLVFKKIGAFT